MPRAARLLLACLPLLVWAPSQAQPPAPPRGPRIALEPARVNFGRVLQNRTLTRQLLIRNLGDQDLLIEGVGSTCDCALGLTEGTRIAPGRSAPLRVVLKTGSASGRLGRSLLIKSNDPTQATLAVSVEALVVPAKSSSARLLGEPLGAAV